MSLNIATELVAHVASYLSGREASGPGGGPQSGRGKKSDLLALRVASKDCRDAVRRAVKTHASCKHISLAPGLHGTYDSPECVAAVGRVFGAGCREVYFQGDSAASEKAFEEFVNNTEGRLRILRVGHGTLMSTARYLNICGACPLLRELYLASPIAGRPMRQLAAEIGRLCPLLEDVWLPPDSDESGTPIRTTPAESYSMFFPRLTVLNFESHLCHNIPRGGYYEPSRFDRIEESARRCVNVVRCTFEMCHVSANLVNCLLRTPLRERLQSLDFWCVGSDGRISQELILQFARSCPALREIKFPSTVTADASPEFYVSLSRARPTLAALNYQCHEDELGSYPYVPPSTLPPSLTTILARFRLEEFEISYLTARVIDAILDSPCAQSLKSIDFGETLHPLDRYRVAAGDLLRLVRGCPRLDYISGDVRFHKARNSDEATSPFDSGLLDAIYEVGDLLEERGGGMGLMIGRSADPPRF